MIEYLMNVGQQVTQPEIVSAAVSLGMDRDQFIETMNSQEIDAQTDVLRSRGWGMRTFLAIVVDGKLIPRWKLEDKPIIEQVVEIAGLRERRVDQFELIPVIR